MWHLTDVTLACEDSLWLRFQSLLKLLLWNKVVEEVKVLNALGPLCLCQCFFSSSSYSSKKKTQAVSKGCTIHHHFPYGVGLKSRKMVIFYQFWGYQKWRAWFSSAIPFIKMIFLRIGCHQKGRFEWVKENHHRHLDDVLRQKAAAVLDFVKIRRGRTLSNFFVKFS